MTEEWGIITLNELVNGDKMVLLEQLQAWGLVPRQGEYLCPKCSAALQLHSNVERAGGWRWSCTNKVVVRKQKRRTCGTVVSFYKGTFFEKSHITIYQMLTFVHLWLNEIPLKFIRDELRIATNTAVNWSSVCREVVLQEFITHPVKLGGPGITVEIEESKFDKRKNYRGNSVEGRWVFGGYERGTGRVFMAIAEVHTADTLVPIIERWIEPGTTIINNCGKSANRLTEDGCNHLTINHSVTFKEAHTNRIEKSWWAAKMVITSGGRAKANIPGNLASYMFYKRCKQLGEDRFEAFLKLAGKLYDPMNPQLQPPDDGDVTEDEILED